MSSVPPHRPGTGPLNGQSDVVPEILRPAEGYIPTPQPMVRRRRSFWATAPATYVLVGINCAVFLAMVMHGVSALSPTPEQLMFWGANNAGAVLNGGQWWRIVTAMFVHGGLLHLATNMWCLWNLGLLAEPLIGWLGVTSAYVLTGAAGNLLSTFFSWYSFPDGRFSPGGIGFPPGVGASGAVFGIAGALIVLLKSKRLPVPLDELKRLRKSVIYFAAINLVIGFSVNVGTRYMGSGLRVDNMAHLGGFSCGLLFAVPLVPRLGSTKSLFETRMRIALALIAGLLVLFSFYLAQLPG
ncbi:MAG TPA: rhomboid family intramembrane serine protease [Terracidiphilus sp.]|nr:rhomboid family intramembrane serine protease [Terracidiphilus sp.]